MTKYKQILWEDTYWQQQKYKQYNSCCIVSRETMNKTQTQTMIKTKRSHEPIKKSHNPTRAGLKMSEKHLLPKVLQKQGELFLKTISFAYWDIWTCGVI